MARPLVLEWSWATRGSSYCPVPEITGILPKVSWLFFKARAKRPYVSHTGRASNAEKQPTGPGPQGCDENGPAAALLGGHVSIQTCSLLAPCRRPILIATIYLLFRGQDTRSSPRPFLPPRIACASNPIALSRAAQNRSRSVHNKFCPPADRPAVHNLPRSRARTCNRLLRKAVSTRYRADISGRPAFGLA